MRLSPGKYFRERLRKISLNESAESQCNFLVILYFLGEEEEASPSLSNVITTHIMLHWADFHNPTTGLQPWVCWSQKKIAGEPIIWTEPLTLVRAAALTGDWSSACYIGKFHFQSITTGWWGHCHQYYMQILMTNSSSLVWPDQLSAQSDLPIF